MISVCLFELALRRHTAEITACRFELENERRNRMSRLTEKLKQASGVVGRQTARIEARADAIIAREPQIEAQTDKAFALHDALLSEAEKGLDALAHELAMVSNDPLGSSGESSEGQEPSKLEIDAAAAGVDPMVYRAFETGLPLSVAHKVVNGS